MFATGDSADRLWLLGYVNAVQDEERRVCRGGEGRRCTGGRRKAVRLSGGGGEAEQLRGMERRGDFDLSNVIATPQHHSRLSVVKNVRSAVFRVPQRRQETTVTTGSCTPPLPPPPHT